MLLVIDVGNTNTVLGVFAPVENSHAGDDLTAEPERYERLVANTSTSSRSSLSRALRLPCRCFTTIRPKWEPIAS